MCTSSSVTLSTSSAGPPTGKICRLLFYALPLILLSQLKQMPRNFIHSWCVYFNFRFLYFGRNNKCSCSLHCFNNNVLFLYLCLFHSATFSLIFTVLSNQNTTSLLSGGGVNANGNNNNLSSCNAIRECAGCCKRITERFLLKALDLYWHEDCLKCGCCDCRLGEVGSTLYTKANLILCKRDYLRSVTFIHFIKWILFAAFFLFFPSFFWPYPQSLEECKRLFNVSPMNFLHTHSFAFILFIRCSHLDYLARLATVLPVPKWYLHLKW